MSLTDDADSKGKTGKGASQNRHDDLTNFQTARGSRRLRPDFPVRALPKLNAAVRTEKTNEKPRGLRRGAAFTRNRVEGYFNTISVNG